MQDSDAPSIPGNIFVIPQDFTGETDKLYCYIDYTVKLNDTGDEQNVKTYVPISQNFEIGKAYRICIDINPGKKIHSAVDVESWPGSELDVNVKNQ